MKKYYCFLLFLFAALVSFSQEIAEISAIDNIVAANENKIAVVYQKTEKNKIEAAHGKNPTHILSVYRFTPDNILLSVTYLLFSVGDTSLVINYHFDSGQLVKVKTVSFGINNHPHEDIFYFSNNQVISKNVDDNGPYLPEYYVNRAQKLLKQLKKKPIKFPA